MEKEIIELTGGLLLTAIIPVIVMRQLQHGAVFSGNLKNQKKITYIITITSIIILSAWNQNSDIIMGTIIGSALFELLGIFGVGRLRNIQREKLKNNHSGQYLIFCAILLLFLSADYLLRGKTVDNVLNRIDGLLLFFLFCIYAYLVYGRGEVSVLYRIRTKDFDYGERHSKGMVNGFSKKNVLFYLSVYFLLTIIIVSGNFLLFDSVSKFGVSFGISQYCSGLTFMAWCINLSGILFSWLIEEKKNVLVGQSDEGVIFSITLLLGGVVLAKPILVTTYMIHDLIFFGIISIFLQLIKNIDNRIAGSGMATVYIAFVIYIFVR